MQCLSTQLLLSHSQPPNKPPIKGIFLTPINLFLRASSKGMPSSKALTPVHRSPPDSLRGHTKPQLAEAIAAVAPLGAALGILWHTGRQACSVHLGNRAPWWRALTLTPTLTPAKPNPDPNPNSSHTISTRTTSTSRHAPFAYLALAPVWLGLAALWGWKLQFHPLWSAQHRPLHSLLCAVPVVQFVHRHVHYYGGGRVHVRVVVAMHRQLH